MGARLSVNVNDETAQDLRELAEKKGISVTEVVRRAVSAYSFLKNETGDGVELVLKDWETQEDTVLFLL